MGKMSGPWRGKGRGREGANRAELSRVRGFAGLFFIFHICVTRKPRSVLPHVREGERVMVLCIQFSCPQRPKRSRGRQDLRV